MNKITLDGYEYVVLKSSFKKGLPSIPNKKYIQYLDDSEITTVDRQSIKNNTFSRYTFVYGVAINDSTEDSDPILIETWRRMIGRKRGPELNYKCSRTQTTINSYIDVQVQESWYKFSNFENWALTQDYIGMELDKDLLGDGMLYSEDTCCFLPHYLNCLLTVQHKGKVPYVGVQIHKNKFKVTPYLYGKRYKFKLFNCPVEAHHYWQEIKIEVMSIVIEDYKLRGEISDKIYNGFMNKISKLKYEHSNRLITTNI